MSLKIMHNISSINAYGNLLKTESSLSKNLQRLSSGSRINSAADDPAGLAISQRFRAQIAGLGQAVENAENAISMVQTAEGSMNEVHNLLTAMRELAVHAANSGLNDTDMLAADQQQIESALESIDRIAATTQFGTKVLLNGANDNLVAITTNSSDIEAFGASELSAGYHYITVDSVVDAAQWINNTDLGLTDPVSVSGLAAGDHTISVIQESDSAEFYGDDITDSVVIAAGSNDDFILTLDGSAAMTVTIATGTYATVSALATAVETAVDTALAAGGFSTSEITVSASDNQLLFTSADHGSESSISIADTGVTSTSALEDLMLSSGVEIGQDAIVTLDNFENHISDVDNATDSSATLYDADGNSVAFTIGSTSDGVDLGTSILTVQATQFLASLDGGSKTRFSADVQGSIQNGADKLDITFGTDVATGTSKVKVSDNSLIFQIGGNEDQTVNLSLASMSSSQLGQINSKLSTIDVTSSAGANSAIQIIDSAISQVSTERSKLGAFQINVLESTLNSLRVSEENLQAAESTLRDTDFAVEMAEFTKNQILQQSGIAILAQANANPQVVLSLIG